VSGRNRQRAKPGATRAPETAGQAIAARVLDLLDSFEKRPDDADLPERAQLAAASILWDVGHYAESILDPEEVRFFKQPPPLPMPAAIEWWHGTLAACTKLEQLASQQTRAQLRRGLRALAERGQTGAQALLAMLAHSFYFVNGDTDKAARALFRAGWYLSKYYAGIVPLMRDLNRRGGRPRKGEARLARIEALQRDDPDAPLIAHDARVTEELEAMSRALPAPRPQPPTLDAVQRSRRRAAQRRRLLGDKT